MKSIEEILQEKYERAARLEHALSHVVAQLKEMGALKIVLYKKGEHR